MKRWVKTAMLLALATTVMAGCGKSKSDAANGTSPAATENPTEPVTLVMYQVGSGVDDTEFQQIIAEPVKKKYPNITVEMYRYAQGENVESLVAAQQYPDMVISGILDVNRLKDLGLITDLNPYIKKYKYDISKLKPATTAMIGKYSDKGEMLAMPYTLGFPIMYYNKDIFDKFAIPYPKDGMSWEDVIDLAGKVTRQVDGVQYQGFDGGGFARLSLSMLQEKYDAKREKALLTTDGWVRAMGYYKQWKSIPGNEQQGTMKRFTKDKTIAMFAGFNGALSQLEDLHKSGDGLNWDMVTFPTFKDQQYEVDTPLQILEMASTTKHKDEVFKVMEVATSKENQMLMSKNARPSVLKDTEIEKAFGQNFESLKGKNTQAPFKYKHKPINVSTSYESIVNKQINAAAKQVLQGVDINTALREAEEAANKEIASQQGK